MDFTTVASADCLDLSRQEPQVLGSSTGTLTLFLPFETALFIAAFGTSVVINRLRKGKEFLLNKM